MFSYAAPLGNTLVRVGAGRHTFGQEAWSRALVYPSLWEVCCKLVHSCTGHLARASIDKPTAIPMVSFEEVGGRG